MNNQSIVAQIQALQGMTVAELRVEWERLYNEPTRSRNRLYLWKRLAWRVQELQYGGLTDAAKAHLKELTPDTFTRARTPAGFQPTESSAEPKRTKTARDIRLPSPGTVLTRRWHGRDLRLLVTHDGGYELDGVRYGSLSEAARAATGAHWNGKLFWGVTPRKRKK